MAFFSTAPHFTARLKGRATHAQTHAVGMALRARPPSHGKGLRCLHPMVNFLKSVLMTYCIDGRMGWCDGLGCTVRANNGQIFGSKPNVRVSVRVVVDFAHTHTTLCGVKRDEHFNPVGKRLIGPVC